jgi:hypothetical protein
MLIVDDDDVLREGVGHFFVKAHQTWEGFFVALQKIRP